MSLTHWLAALFLCAAEPSPPARPTARPPKPAKQDQTRKPQRPMAALVDLTGLVTDEERTALDAGLRALIPAFDLDLQPQARTQQARRDLNGLGLCADASSVECLVQVGALSKTRVVLAGVLSPVDGGTQLELVGVDVGGMRERGRVKVVVPAAGEGRTQALESALTGVLRPEAWLGTLRVSVAQRGASVIVDGAPRGFSPLSEALELAPGPHALFVSLEGFSASKTTVEVAYKTETVTEVALSPGEGEPAPGMTLARAGAGGAPAGAGEGPAATPTPAARRLPLRVIMYDINAVGVDPRVARVMAELLVAEIRKRDHVSVLDSSELRALVGDGRSTAVDARGCKDTECFAEVADALGADAVVVTTLTNIQGQILFGLRRVDPHKQEVAGTFLKRVPADDTSALLPLVGEGVARIFLDVPLRAGQRVGVDEHAAQVMNPPPLPPLLAGSLYAGTAVSALAALGLLGTAAGVWLNYDARVRAFGAPASASHEVGDENAQLAPLRDAWEVTTSAGAAALVATAVFGTAALITGAFTDWDGYGADSVPTK